jgi:hypothetical protein
VLPIWEGTTNILSLDALRVIRKHGAGFLKKEIQRLADSAGPQASASETGLVQSRLGADCAALERMILETPAGQERAIRGWIESVARTFTLAAVLNAKSHPGLEPVATAAFRYLAARPGITSPPGAFGKMENDGGEEILLRSGFDI